MKIPINEDGIIVIAETLYGADSDDAKVFRDAAETRKERSSICIRYRQLRAQITMSEESADDVYSYLSKEFNKSIDMIKKIIRKKHIYDPKCRK